MELKIQTENLKHNCSSLYSISYKGKETFHVGMSKDPVSQKYGMLEKEEVFSPAM